MLRLWGRMMHIGPRDKAKREADRSELSLTLVESIARMANLPGLDLTVYREELLPKLAELFSSCRDQRAQQCLLDSIVQNFPDRYHLHTLPSLLQMSYVVEQGAPTKASLAAIMERFASFVSGATPAQRAEINEVDQNTSILGLFQKCLAKLLEEQQGQAPVKKLLELPLAFINCALKSFPKTPQSIDSILESCVTYIFKPREGQLLPGDCKRSVDRVMAQLVETVSIDVADMPNLPTFLTYLPQGSRKAVSKQVATVNTANKS